MDFIDKTKTDYLNEINVSIANTSIKDFIKDEVKLTHVKDYGKEKGYRFYHFYLEIELQDEFKKSFGGKEVEGLLKKFEDSSLQVILGESKKYEYFTNNFIVDVDSITLKHGNNTYKIEPQSSFQLYKNGSILKSKPVKSKKSASPKKKDMPESPYTKEELENDPSAPSNNPEDYNSEGEYVPSDGSSNNPEDYNQSGEHKPVEEMTQEEIKKELEEMFKN